MFNLKNMVFFVIIKFVILFIKLKQYEYIFNISKRIKGEFYGIHKRYYI